MIPVSTPDAVESRSYDSLAIMSITDGRRLAGTTALDVPWMEITQPHDEGWKLLLRCQVLSLRLLFETTAIGRPLFSQNPRLIFVDLLHPDLTYLTQRSVLLGTLTLGNNRKSHPIAQPDFSIFSFYATSFTIYMHTYMPLTSRFAKAVPRLGKVPAGEWSLTVSHSIQHSDVSSLLIRQ